MTHLMFVKEDYRSVCSPDESASPSTSSIDADWISVSVRSKCPATNAFTRYACPYAFSLLSGISDRVSIYFRYR